MQPKGLLLRKYCPLAIQYYSPLLQHEVQGFNRTENPPCSTKAYHHFELKTKTDSLSSNTLVKAAPNRLKYHAVLGRPTQLNHNTHLLHYSTSVIYCWANADSQILQKLSCLSVQYCQILVQWLMEKQQIPRNPICCFW